MKAGEISIKDVQREAMRYDSPYHLSEAMDVKKAISNSPYPLYKIKDVSSKIFNGGRYRRVYLCNPAYGNKFLSSSDILAADLETVKIVSKRYMSGVEELKLEKGWTLITRSGTIGKTAFANAKHAQKLASEDVIRLVPNNILRAGIIYSYLSSKYGYILLTQGTFGGMIQHIECNFVGEIPIPNFPEEFQKEVDERIQESAKLREESADELMAAERLLKDKAGLRDLTPDDYDYFGPRSYQRRVNTFSRNIQEIGTISFNAFNHSKRIDSIKGLIAVRTKTLKEILVGGDTFSTGSFPRIEVKEPHGIMLINQSDIFDTIVKGKHISLRNVSTSNLVEYGEVMIAGVGTLGENETFCRTIFANEDLVGQLVSGEFIRMKTNKNVPSGFLYAWLASDYGFRIIRSIQAGTKLCRPIPKLLLELPVPILPEEDMREIDRMVRDAHTKRHKANRLELEAIKMVEDEIEKWNK